VPFQSKAQVRKFGSLVAQGKISSDKFAQWRAETPNMASLPDRKKAPKAVKRVLTGA